MLRRLASTLPLVFAASALTGACAVTPDASDKEDVASEAVDALTGTYRDLGEIPGTGEARTAKYANPPRYAAFTFYANGGEEVDAWVRGQKGTDDDAVAWILDAKTGAHLASNDDATATTRDAHLVAKLPAKLGTKAKLLLVFRDYALKKALFTVSVRVAPGMYACATDGDCAKISKGGCCTAWQHVAVNASRADDYAADNQCKPPYPPCAPPPAIEDTTVPVCDAGACKLGCSYDGKGHAVGASFPATDGCNTCTCGEGGSVGCTKIACLPKCDPAKEKNRKYVGSSPEKCMVIKFACEAGTAYFGNDCGCGCEQPSDCPASIDCMPGPGKTPCAAERARCPYSPVAF